MARRSNSRILTLLKLTLIAFFFILMISHQSMAQDGRGDDGGDDDDFEKNGGGFPTREYPNPPDEDTTSIEELTELAKFAIDEYCKKNSMEPLAFSKLIYAEVQAVSGASQNLVIECMDRSGQAAWYLARVWEQVWMNRKELMEFTKLDQDDYKEEGIVVGSRIREYPSSTHGVDVNIETMEELEGLANFAIHEYCKKNSLEPHLTFSKLISAKVQVVSGEMHYLLFECTDSYGELCRCEAQIWEQPWRNRRELVAFKKIDQANGPTVGGPRVEYPSPTDDDTEAPEELTDLAKFAVDEYCRTNTMEKLTFWKLISAEVQVVSGVMHRLVIECIDHGSVSRGELVEYEARIWEQPWMKHKQLVEFKMVDPRADNGGN